MCYSVDIDQFTSVILITQAPINNLFMLTGSCPLPPKPHRKYALRYCEQFHRYVGIEMNYINKKWRGVSLTDITGVDNTKHLVSRHKSNNRSSKTDKIM